jgi:hypothetical protein
MRERTSWREGRKEGGERERYDFQERRRKSKRFKRNNKKRIDDREWIE